MKVLLTLILNVYSLISIGQVMVTSGLNEQVFGNPGEVKFVDIQLRNPGLSPAKASFTLSDYVNSCKKGYLYLEPGSTKNSIADWLTFETSEITLRPKEKATIRVLFEIPIETTLSNGHICVFVNNKPVIEEVPSSGEIFQIGVSTRYAINVLFNNTSLENSKPDLKVQNFLTNEKDSRFEFEYINVGSASAKFTCKLEVVDTSGAVIQSVNSKQYIIQPDQCRVVKTPINFNPNGQLYTLVLVAQTINSNDLFGFSFETTLK